MRQACGSFLFVQLLQNFFSFSSYLKSLCRSFTSPVLPFTPPSVDPPSATVRIFCRPCRMASDRCAAAFVLQFRALLLDKKPLPPMAAEAALSRCYAENPQSICVYLLAVDTLRRRDLVKDDFPARSASLLYSRTSISPTFLASTS